MSTTQQQQTTQTGQQQQQQPQHIAKGGQEESKVAETHAAAASGKKSGEGQITKRGEAGTISVRDIFDKELMKVGQNEVDKQQIGWLKERMMDQMEQVRGLSKNLGKDEQVYVYSTFGSWYGDETPLKEVKGDLKFFRRGPQEGKYEMNVQLPDQRQVKVDVSDDSTVGDVKQQVAQRSGTRIPPNQQILAFQQRALLDDFATLGALRVPPFGVFDLLW
jgi:hypothetical protein